MSYENINREFAITIHFVCKYAILALHKYTFLYSLTVWYFVGLLFPFFRFETIFHTLVYLVYFTKGRNKKRDCFFYLIVKYYLCPGNGSYVAYDEGSYNILLWEVIDKS